MATLIDLGDDDPFVTIKKEVEKALGTAKGFLAQFNKMLADPTIVDGDEFEWTTKELRKLVETVTDDLDEMGDAVQAMKADPKRFRLTVQEITSREKFVSDGRLKLQEITVRINDPKAKLQNYQQARKNLLGAKAKGGRYAKLEEDISAQNQSFIETQVDRQEVIIKNQDKQVEDLAQDLQTLGVLAHQIDDELEEQNELLGNLGNEMDTVGARLTATLQKLDKAMNLTKDKKQTCCICILLIVVILLIITYTII